MPFVTLLTATLLITLASQTACPGLFETVTGRRLAAVATVLGQLIPQGLNRLTLSLNRFLLFLDCLSLLANGLLLLLDVTDETFHQLYYLVILPGINWQYRWYDFTLARQPHFAQWPQLWRRDRSLADGWLVDGHTIAMG
jgi:hypothetical protein